MAALLSKQWTWVASLQAPTGHFEVMRLSLNCSAPNTSYDKQRHQWSWSLNRVSRSNLRFRFGSCRHFFVCSKKTKTNFFRWLRKQIHCMTIEVRHRGCHKGQAQHEHMRTTTQELRNLIPFFHLTINHEPADNWTSDIFRPFFIEGKHLLQHVV